jgi:hypothetical protein
VSFWAQVHQLTGPSEGDQKGHLWYR